MTVEKRSVRRSKIAQIRMRRIHFQQAVMTREIPVVRQTEVSIRTAADQKAIVLCKRKDAAFVWAGCDFQIDLHWRSMCDREIVKRHFVDVAGVESYLATPEVFRVGDSRQILTVDVEQQLSTLDSHLQNVRSAAGMDGARRCFCHD